MNILSFLLCSILLPSNGHCLRQSSGISKQKVNAMKGILALLILLSHCANKLGLDARYSFFAVGWYCVGMFFFLSGYGVTLQTKSKHQGDENYFDTFWTRRIPKILIPYVVAHIVYFFVKESYGIQFNIKQIVMGLLGQSTIVDNSWYPVAAVMMYAIFWIAIKTNRVTLIAGGLLIALTTAEALLFSNQKWWYISNLPFLAGIVLAYYDEKIEKKGLYLAIGMLGVVTSYCLERMSAFQSFAWYVVISNIKCGSLVLLAIVLSISWSIPNKWAIFLGNISYELYLLHGLFIFIMSKIDKLDDFSFFLSVILLSVPSAYVMHRIDEKLVSFCGKVIRRK